MGGGLIAVDQRASDGGPVLEPGEEGEPGEVLLHSQPDVGLVLGESDVDESGNLYITSKRVVWHSTHTPHGIAVSLVDLSMHAISRDLEAYPKPCIYTQRLSLVSEMRLVPRDEAALDAIFKALCDSAALNPDPEGAEQELEGDWYYNEDEVLRNARVVLPEGDPDQFEDADEDEEEEGAGAAAGS
ncbi:unnamed protein product [Closterium sp. Yama58-4]|nr:unnamed protein product [Closterium sp. Yama58-4]